jgi:hypothetical protein
LSLIDEELRNDKIDPLLKATCKNILDKINDQIQFQHHNSIDDFVCSMLNTYYPEEDD